MGAEESPRNSDWTPIYGRREILRYLVHSQQKRERRWGPGERRLSLQAKHSFRTKGRRGTGGCRCILQLLWELSPSQPPWCCVCPPGERGQCIWTERTDSQNSVALWDLSHQRGHAVCLNHSTLPTKSNSPPPGRLGAAIALTIRRASSAFCGAEPPRGMEQREFNPVQRDGQHWPGLHRN